MMKPDLDVSHSQVREDDYRLGSQIRDNMANEMWRVMQTIKFM